MDYEKLHKSTLAALQQRVSEGKITEEIARSICADFVNESEDERIRKALKEYFINSFQNNGVAAICGAHIKDIISWLKTQGEHANFRNKIQIGDKVTRNEDGVLVNLSQFKRMVKQGKQKPIEWAADDLLKRNQIITILKEYNRTDLIAWLEKIEIIWLKSLKERVQPQPKQEWSEEDENGLGDALWAIEQARTIAKDENDMGNLWHAEYWLKSLKEKYAWKPSEEQMKALNYVINLMASSESPTENDYYYNVFKDLRTHLKKLREE